MKKIKNIIKKIIPRIYYSKLLSLYHYFRLLAYSGLKYECSFCNGRFRKLLPIGLKNDISSSIIGGGYRYAVCPKCHSTDRERLVYWYIVNKKNIFYSRKMINLLHIAPEKNLQKVFRASDKINYINGDLNPLIADRRIDITDIKFENNFFDFIICNHVLEHVKDDKKAMSELFRVLKPGGEAILQVPISKYNQETFEDFSITSPEEREKIFGQKDHVRIYGKDFQKRLENAGFEVNLYDIKKDLNIRNIEKFGLNKEEILYIGKKM